jgi:hypothetical protein
MTTISFAYAYSFFIFYVLSSQNVQNLILIYKCYILQQQMRVWGEKNIHVWFYVKGYSKWEKVY